ncbi:MAG: helix-turn-helix transcriptional regulator [Fidelibacterota bacterium]|nr:MAG: helix-turn-helix transcriptional regulator [Candidatus Neomarinimicrobiota bacterium]
MGVHEIRIKNMVCDRCIRVVREELVDLRLDILDVQLGLARFKAPDKTLDLEAIRTRLEANGFVLLEDQNAKLVERIRQELIALIRNEVFQEPDFHISTHLANRIGRSYPYLSSLFSSVAGMTIERFFILQRIEWAKELLAYGELTVSEIAYRLGYSSVQHLSRQFKTVTGLTPSHFRQLRTPQRKSLDKLGES